MTRADKTGAVLDLRYLPPLLTRAQVARLRQCSERSIFRAEAAGVLPAMRSPGSPLVRYRREVVLRWLGLSECGA